MKKELFSEEEWVKLQIAVIWMFQAIAGADKNIDDEEIEAFKYVHTNAEKIQSELLREVLKDFNIDEDEITGNFAKDEQSIKAGLRDLAKLLDEKLEQDESLLFKKSLLALGMYVAYSSGDLLSSKMSNQELQLLVELSLYMKISKAIYREEPTVFTLMDHFNN